MLMPGTFSCSGPSRKETSPAESLQEARVQYEKRQFDSAIEILDDLKIVTAGTALGGEVQFLLAESNFRLRNYLEAESHYSSYLSAYPNGPFASEAIFKRATANIRLIQRKVIGLFKIKTVLPHDRDIEPLRRARLLFQEYLDKYPDGDKASEAEHWINLLLEKEGYHELGVARFYLKKKQPEAVLSRTSRILGGQYPPSVKKEAEVITEKARALKGTEEPAGGEN